MIIGSSIIGYLSPNTSDTNPGTSNVSNGTSYSYGGTTYTGILNISSGGETVHPTSHQLSRGR